MSDHTEPRAGGASYQCPTCSKFFSSNSHLRRHEASHTRSRSNTCAFCNRTFIRHDVLRRHSKSCQQRGEHDAIASARPGRPPRSGKTDGQAQMSGLFASGIHTSNTNRHTTMRAEDAQTLLPYPITFLYRYTDPRRDSILNAFAGERTLAQPINNEIVSNAGNQVFEGDMALFGIFSDLFMDMDADTCASASTAPGRSQPIPIFQSRVDELCSKLFSYSKSRRTAVLDCDDAFPVNAAQAVFTAENFEACAWAYFTVFHPQQPLIHWPTFDMHNVSLSLLLAVVFGGSVHCSPTDGALSCRAFFDLGEEFIFEQLRHVVLARPNLSSDPRALEHVQAGLLIVALQSSFNSEAVRRRVRVSRHPELAVAIRSLKLLDPMSDTSPHNEVPRWNAFIAEESRVRIVHFMCVMDYMNTFFFNLLPNLAIGEIHQRLPCNDALYDAWTPEEYEQLCIESSRPTKQIPSIKQLVALLMSENWLDEQRNPLLNILELRHLMICIFALHSIIFVSRAALLTQSSHNDLLRATKRWKDLWDTLHAKREAEHKKSLGFVRHGLEMWWVACKVLELAQVGDSQSRYMAVSPTDSLVDLHGFLKQYGNCVDG